MAESSHPHRQEIFQEVYIVCSILSAIVSAFLVLTCFLFPSYGNKYFMRLVFWMSICDVCASSVAAFGYPLADTWLCSFQAFWSWYFFRAYWVWTVILSYQLYRLILRQQLIAIHYLHLTAWPLSLAGALMPLTSGATYGMIDRFSGNAWCFLDNCSRSELRFWVYATLQSFVWSSILLMVFFFCRAYFYYYSQGEFIRNSNDPRLSEFHRVLQQGIFQISLYPLALMLSWGPIMIIFPLFDYGVVPLLYFDIALVMGTLNGVFAGSIFILRSKEARVLWYRFLFYELWNRDPGPSQKLFMDPSSDLRSSCASSRASWGEDGGDVGPYGDNSARSSTWDTSRFFSFSRSTTTASERIESIEITILHRSSIFAYDPSSAPQAQGELERETDLRRETET
jgi:hypothetical protein